MPNFINGPVESPGYDDEANHLVTSLNLLMTYTFMENYMQI